MPLLSLALVALLVSPVGATVALAVVVPTQVGQAVLPLAFAAFMVV